MLVKTMDGGVTICSTSTGAEAPGVHGQTSVWLSDRVVAV